MPEHLVGDILELGAGWGTLAFPLAALFPDNRVLAYELSTGAVVIHEIAPPSVPEKQPENHTTRLSQSLTQRGRNGGRLSAF